MTVLTRSVATATKLINKYGANATWKVYGSTVDNSQPWKSTAPGTGPTEYAIKIVLLPESTGDNPLEMLSHLLAGTSVPVGAEQGLMAGSVAFVPAVNDSVVINGKTRQFKAIDTLQPDGNPILYTLTFA